MTRKERERLAKLRPAIIRAFVALEQQYGESAVSGAYSRHRAIRTELRKLRRSRAVSAAKIRKLKG